MSSETLPHHHVRFYSPLAVPLLDEWTRLSSDRATSNRLARWQRVGGPSAENLDDLLQQTGFFGSRNDDDADQLLLQVVRLAADDALAARLVLQRVLPGLVNVAKRRGGRSPRGRHEAFAELTASAWIVIRTYPADRRPQHIAANIVRDAEYQAFVRNARLRSSTHVDLGLDLDAPGGHGRVSSNDDGDVTRAVEPMSEVIDVLSTARDAGVSETDLRFAAAWASGWSTKRLADGFDMCERSARNRRALVAARLRAAVRDADAA
jgi:hypothetical protein